MNQSVRSRTTKYNSILETHSQKAKTGLSSWCDSIRIHNWFRTNRRVESIYSNILRNIRHTKYHINNESRASLWVRSPYSYDAVAFVALIYDIFGSNHRTSNWFNSIWFNSSLFYGRAYNACRLHTKARDAHS